MKTTFFAKTALIALSVALLAPLASADTVDFSGSTLSGDTFSGVFTVVPDAHRSGAYDITSITGFVDGVAIDTAASAAAYSGPFTYIGIGNSNTPNGLFAVDDLYYSSGNPFDYNGPLFILTDGTEVNPYYNDATSGSGFLESSAADGSNYMSSPIISISTTLNIDTNPVPEPTSLALFGTGILGLAGVARRRFKA